MDEGRKITNLDDARFDKTLAAIELSLEGVARALGKIETDPKIVTQTLRLITQDILEAHRLHSEKKFTAMGEALRALSNPAIEDIRSISKAWDVENPSPQYTEEATLDLLQRSLARARAANDY